jgi:2-methylcitrate dehydratase PrpD
MKLMTKLDPEDAGYFYITPESVKDDKTFVAALAAGKCVLLVMLHKQAFQADPQVIKDIEDACKAHILRVSQMNQMIEAEEKAKSPTTIIKGS